jgi:transaldolase / glucose-6-phosphate isomerase
VYESSKFRDGYVSLEVSPLLAHKTQETIDEARRLWKAVERENVMIKVPGTPEGLPAIRQAIGEGINVNVTLLFAQEVYEKVAEAHIAGLEDLAKRGGNLNKIGGVASFFISRIDSLVDSLINEKLKASSDAQRQALLKSLLGKVAIANGKAHLSALSAHLQQYAMGSAGSQGSADSKSPVGEHQHEKSCVS